MHISILHNRDGDVLEEDPGREAREDVVQVAAAVADALSKRGVEVDQVPVGSDLSEVAEALKRHRPDAVLNLCESLAADSRGEMAIPCWLDVLGIPYTGSAALALGLCLHKDKAKELLFARGVPTPSFRVVETIDELAKVDLGFPLIVKPSREDASVGIDFSSVVHDRTGLRRAVLSCLRTFHQPALVESYIDGREIYVPLLGNGDRHALPLTEIAFGKAFEGKPRILSYRAKWELTSAECIESPSVECALDGRTQARVVATALAAFQALGCRDYGRVDLRLGADGCPYVIDINPNCDLHPDAGFAKAARAAGIEYADLALKLVDLALERTHGHSTSRRSGQGTARRPAAPNRDVLAPRSAVRARADRPRAAAEQP